MPIVEGIKYGFNTDRIIVVLAYTIAVFGAWVSIQFFPESDLWIRIAIGDIVATFIIFISSFLLKNSSMYDPYWSVAPIIILIYVLFYDGVLNVNLRNVMVSVIN